MHIEKKFDLYSENFSKLSKHHNWYLTNKTDGSKVLIDQLVYPCPLCHSIFVKEHLSNKFSNHLTKEDVPPKSLGGKPILLTCRECNTTSGHNFDHHLNSDLKIRDAMKGEKTEIKFIVNDNKPIKITLELKQGEHNEFRLNFPKHNYADRLIKEMSENWDGLTGKMQIEGPSIKRNNIAHLRIGYLLMFEVFGYAYIYCDGGKYIRHVINTGEYEIEPLINKNPKKALESGVYIVDKFDFKLFLISYNLKLKNNLYNYQTFLPGPEIEDIRGHNKISRIDSFNFRIHMLPKELFKKDIHAIFKI